VHQDVISWSKGIVPDKIISKETLNHAGLIEMVSGLNVYQETQKAYLSAYEALGIDIINRVPSENAPAPTASEKKSIHTQNSNYTMTSLGVYDTAFRHSFECKNIDDVWNFDIENFSYEDLLVPVPHSCRQQDIKLREEILGNIGLYYPMLYTTLFMWPVEILGWEIFMLAATLESEKFFEKFLLPCAKKSKKIVKEIAESSDSPFVFLHDDLASAQGPVFPPRWYDEFIFPLYPDIFEPAKKMGKKIIFVADGNMSTFLPRLINVGVDGIMFENPATPLEAVIEHFGQTGNYFIGGIETAKLTFGSPDEIQKMVLDIGKKCSKYKGFAIASCGGLHGNIPLSNLEAYFDARAIIGASPADWRTKFVKL